MKKLFLLFLLVFMLVPTTASAKSDYYTVNVNTTKPSIVLAYFNKNQNSKETIKFTVNAKSGKDAYKKIKNWLVAFRNNKANKYGVNPCSIEKLDDYIYYHKTKNTYWVISDGTIAQYHQMNKVIERALDWNVGSGKITTDGGNVADAYVDLLFEKSDYIKNVRVLKNNSIKESQTNLAGYFGLHDFFEQFHLTAKEYKEASDSVKWQIVYNYTIENSKPGRTTYLDTPHATGVEVLNKLSKGKKFYGVCRHHAWAQKELVYRVALNIDFEYIVSKHVNHAFNIFRLKDKDNNWNYFATDNDSFARLGNIYATVYLPYQKEDKYTKNEIQLMKNIEKYEKLNEYEKMVEEAFVKYVAADEKNLLEKSCNDSLDLYKDYNFYEASIVNKNADKKGLYDITVKVVRNDEEPIENVESEKDYEEFQKINTENKNNGAEVIEVISADHDTGVFTCLYDDDIREIPFEVIKEMVINQRNYYISNPSSMTSWF